MIVNLKIGEEVSRQKLLRQFTELQYTRNDMSFVRGTFRVRGDSIEIFPAHLESIAWRITLFGDEIEEIYEVDALTGEKLAKLKTVKIYANSHYVTPRPTLNEAIKSIKEELKVHLEILYKNNKLVEAQRLEQRTNFDIEMMLAAGTCPGIENYSRYLSGRNPGEPPPTLFEYLPDNALVFTDESHITVSQIGAMYKGDFRRKSTLSEYGFRLPSCLDNRPLKFEEWEAFRPQTIHVSATPGDWELNKTNGVFIEQALRPTGLVDPEIIIRPTKTQVDDLIYETKEQSKKGNRVLITTLTKKMAEALSEYMFEAGLKVRYIHSDVDTLERIEIIRDLRLGVFDALIGINLLREGLDIPECALVAILDADKEGYLRSKTSLIQTIGRAARHVEGKVVLYADTITGSMKYAIDETERRRKKQIEYNKTNNITPKTVISKISDILAELNNNEENQKNKKSNQTGKTIKQSIEELEIEMDKAASNLEFEEAAKIRDEIKKLKQKELGLMIVPKENNRK
jgi:excinuclease ABC subunit B